MMVLSPNLFVLQICTYKDAPKLLRDLTLPPVGNNTSCIFIGRPITKARRMFIDFERDKFMKIFLRKILLFLWILTSGVREKRKCR